MQRVLGRGSIERNFKDNLVRLTPVRPRLEYHFGHLDVFDVFNRIEMPTTCLIITDDVVFVLPWGEVAKKLNSFS
jgi:hypothetical protein